ncbi:hypothetical protein ACH5RR_036113 [Cinchona calisaya]|uniref:BRO1 domain-containing protein n=1 Tax=Cinchona calisaya TaxID=153742 RepID=A0ABD2Y714_9GENT
MMINYSGLSKLKTKKVVFHEVFAASDSDTLEQLKELSSKRRVIEGSINESSSITEAIAREMSGGLTSRCEQDIQKLEQYLPLLENLVYHVNTVRNNPSVVRWTSGLKLRWTSALSSSSIIHLKGPKYFQINDLRFELGMMLFLYGTMLREKALEILQTDLVQSTALYRKAAGVYQHLAQEVLPPLRLVMAVEKLPESTSSVSSVMSLVCLAEAQAVTARKAEQKGNSQSLLAKLHCGVRDILDEALGILHSATKDCKAISSRLADFIMSCRTLHELKSHKYLAESLLKTDGNIGAAVGVLRHTLSNVEKSSLKEDSWRLVFKQLTEEITELLRKSEHENDFVWHEKIPTRYELPSLEAVKIVSPIPYQPQRSEKTLTFKI